jgi:hypothetical protein
VRDRPEIGDQSPIPVLPSIYGPDRGEPLPRGIEGATILKIGMLPLKDGRRQAEGGGLVIEYLPRGESRSIRAVLAFTELGMWVDEIS